MKAYLYIVEIFLAVVLVHCEFPEDFKQQMRECAKEVGLKGIPQVPLNHDDPKIKCFHSCVMIKRGSMNYGKADAEKTVELIALLFPYVNEDVLKEDVAECVGIANKVGKNGCEVATDIHICLLKKHPPPQ